MGFACTIPLAMGEANNLISELGTLKPTQAGELVALVTEQAS